MQIHHTFYGLQKAHLIIIIRSKTVMLDVVVYSFLLFSVKLVLAEDCFPDGDVRLVADGATINEGRVEICLGGEWGTVCDHIWGAADARVVCRQLGLPAEHADALYRYGGGSGPIHYAGFACSGAESALAACLVEQNASIANITNCRHFEDAGVRCTDVPCVENTVRLNEEVVQICHNQQWGLVCASAQSWNPNAAQLVCNKVGTPSTNPRSATRRLLFYDAPVILNDVLCTGTEQSILNCTRLGFGIFNNCSNISVSQCEAREPCSDESPVRLTQLSSDRIGRLEVCARGIWGTVCGNGATDAIASVVCRQLNHATIGLLLIESDQSIVFDNLVPIRRTNVVCNGNESTFAQCSFDGANGDSSCTHGNDVIIVCSSRECNEGDVRLVNGQTSTDGRVEICLDGLWGSVCDDRWDAREAAVVCRQLQFDGPSYPLQLHSNRQDTAPLIHLDDVDCDGTETTLAECRHQGIGVHDCAAGLEEAGVICTNTTCVDGTVHLVGGDSILRGRVEYCYQGTWHSVCASGWDDRGNEARVICRSLGYDFESSVVNYGRGMSPLLPQRVVCDVDAEELGDCIQGGAIDVSQCPHVAGVNCGSFCLTVGHTDCNECRSREMCRVISRATDTPICNCYSDCYDYGDCCTDVSHVENCVVPECETGAVRLVGGVTNSTGRLEVCGNGVWGRVCNRLQYWGPDNAQIVCRQLGFSGEGAYVVQDQLPHVYGMSDRVFLLGEVHCVGNEPELLECSHTSIGVHSCGRDATSIPDDIIISCRENTSCEEGEVRLRDGVDPSNGRVEYCRHRTWGAVCSEGWDDSDARVVCSQLGYNPDDARVVEDFVNSKGVPTTLSNVDCKGSETGLRFCTSALPTAECGRSGGVTCGNSSNKGRCTGSPGTLPESISFGVCEVYGEKTDMCEGILRLGTDYVYVSNTLGTQSSIAQLLNRNIETAKDIIATHDVDCLELVSRLICSYYLPLCGNATHLQSPSSICKEECSHVQETCSATWQAVMLAFDDLDPFLDCEDTSRIIFPLPSCCNGAGIVLQQSPTGESITSNDSGTVAGIVVGVILLLAAAAAILVFIVVFYKKQYKKRQLEQVQLDIMAIPGNNPEHRPTVLPMDYGTPYMRNEEIEPEEKASPVTIKPNPYDVPRPAGGTRNISAPTYENRPRVPSSRLRELTRGKFVLEYKDINLMETIGEGEFGIVYKARLSLQTRSTRLVAVKTLKGDFSQIEFDKFLEESLKMSRFKHSHVMGLVGVCLDAGSAPLIIMPYMENGSLLQYLKHERETLVVSEENEEDDVQDVRKRLLAMCSQIASGMEYLAAEKYIHRDLASRNCMIDANFLIKITDFGLSEDVFYTNYFRQGSSEEVVKLPVKWMAPESLSDGHFSEKSDVWSYGVTMWEIFSGGKAPYPGTDPLSLMQSLEKGDRLPPPHNTACTEEIYTMMRKCWEVSPKNRPTFKELHSNISKYISRIAGYLEMGFNPFAGNAAGRERKTPFQSHVGTEDEKSGVAIQVVPPSVPANGAHPAFLY